MTDSLMIQARHALQIAIAFTPWLLSMYVLYWLDYGEIWTAETDYRGVMAVAILTVGMGLSFLVQSYFYQREQK